MTLHRHNRPGRRGLAALLVLALLGSCIPPPRSDPATPLELEPATFVAGLPSVLCLMPLVEEAVEVHRSLSHELSGSFNLHTLEVDQLDFAGLGAALSRIGPQALVLIDNRSLALYREYQRLQPASAELPPALALMAAFGAESQRRLRNTSVITYQVPGVTGVVALRRLTSRPVHRVGVVYRRPFARFIEDNRRLARVENVALVAAPVDTEPTFNQVGWALDRLLGGAQPVDALWVVNDNILLSAAQLREVWLPAIHGRRVPVIVGVESLVNPQLDFGTLAVLPDPHALGMQAADHLFRLAEADFQADPTVEPPVAVRTVVDAVQAELLGGLRRDALDTVERVIR